MNNISVNQIFESRQAPIETNANLSLGPPYDFLHRDIETKLSIRSHEIQQKFEYTQIVGARTASLLKLANDELNPGQLCDLFISSLHLHHENDVRGFLRHAYQKLKPGGWLLGCVIGETSFMAERSLLIQQEIKYDIKHAPHFSPMIELKSMARLMIEAGFIDPVCDVESYVLEYASLRKAHQDIKAMGETNKMCARRKTMTPKNVFKPWLDCDVSLHVALDFIFFRGLKKV